MCHDRAIGDFALEIAECFGMQVVDLTLTNLALGARKSMPKAQRHRAEYVRWRRCVPKLGDAIPPA